MSCPSFSPSILLGWSDCILNGEARVGPTSEDTELPPPSSEHVEDAREDTPSSPSPTDCKLCRQPFLRSIEEVGLTFDGVFLSLTGVGIVAAG